MNINNESKENNQTGETNFIKNFVICDTFESMNLPVHILDLIYNFGYRIPSVVQGKVIPSILSGYNVISQSPSGTGKTGTFLISVLSSINIQYTGIQSIIVLNTRDLAKQVYSICNLFLSKGNFKPTISLCVGGDGKSRNTIVNESLRSNILIGTPGRLYDILLNIQKKSDVIKKIKMIILDEFDILICGDLYQKISEILNILTSNTQICMFSATCSKNSMDICKHIVSQNKYCQIIISEKDCKMNNIYQYNVIFDSINNKHLDNVFLNSAMTIIDLVSRLTINKCVIFVNEIHMCESLFTEIEQNGVSCIQLHGNMELDDRNKKLISFSESNIRVLITTDILARGIDIQSINLVINFNIPNNIYTYKHRIGRTGRFGRLGVVINFITSFNDKRLIYSYSRDYDHPIEDLPDIEKVNNLLTTGTIEECIPYITAGDTLLNIIDNFEF